MQEAGRQRAVAPQAHIAGGAALDATRDGLQSALAEMTANWEAAKAQGERTGRELTAQLAETQDDFAAEARRLVLSRERVEALEVERDFLTVRPARAVLVCFFRGPRGGRCCRARVGGERAPQCCDTPHHTSLRRRGQQGPLH